MAKSVVQQVNVVLGKDPNISNTDLYIMFPKVPKNTLRNYKSKFKKELVKRPPRQKTTKKTVKKVTSNSLRSKVFDFFKNNPKATNQNLYTEFSDFSKNKLRHYKASFFKTTNISPATPQRVKDSLVKKINTVKETRKNESISRLEKRIATLEKQVKKLAANTDSIPSNLDVAKSVLTTRAEGVEKKIKEFEENILSYISEKKKKVKDEMSNLDELQQVVSKKITTFLASIKIKK